VAEAVTGCGIRVYAAQRWQLEGGPQQQLRRASNVPVRSKCKRCSGNKVIEVAFFRCRIFKLNVAPLRTPAGYHCPPVKYSVASISGADNPITAPTLVGDLLGGRRCELMSVGINSGFAINRNGKESEPSIASG
jgi:hypothetical protein